MKRAIVGASIVVLLSASLGCSRDRAEPDADPTAEATATPAPTPCSIDGASKSARTNPSDAPISPVTDVRYGVEGCPRIVFEFQGQVPGYSVAYADPPFSDCGSGEPVDTADWEADAFIEVKLEPSASVDLAKEAEPTYAGPRDIDIDAPILKHMKVTCDFEAHFDWVVGLDTSRSFEVVTYTEPPRLVIGVNEAT